MDRNKIIEAATRRVVTGALGEAMKAINLDDFDIDAPVRALIPQHLWVSLCAFPVNVAGPSLIVAMRDPSDLAAIDDLRFLTGRFIEPVVSSELSIRRTMARYAPAPRTFLN